MKKAICVILVLATLFANSYAHAGFSATPDAQPSVQTFDTQASLKTWMRYGWKVVLNALGKFIESRISLSGDTYQGSNYVQLVSPDIEFLDDTNGVTKSFRFKPEVDESIYKIRMYGHRVIAVDIFSKLGIALFEDSTNVPVHEDVVTTHEFSTYEPTGSENFGSWVAEYTSTDNVEWQLFYVHFWDGAQDSSDKTAVQLQDSPGVYFGPNNRVFYYTENAAEGHLPASFSTQRFLNMTALNNQFLDENGRSVDNLRDYSIGDTVLFSDEIQSMTYDSENDITAFFFQVGEEMIPWKFAGDYRNIFSPGDMLTLHFNVVKIGEFENHLFESLDYFEAVYASQETPPSLAEYLE